MAIKSLLLRNRVEEEIFLESLQRFKDFFDEAKTCFIKRDAELDMLSYMFICSEHGILVGPPGTAKTMIWDKIIQNVRGVKLFEIEVNPFMAEDALFGPYNFKLMKEEGRLRHNTENTLADAHLARVGEALDANPALQRTKLSALNERKFNRGTQQLDLPLHSAYMDTNKDITEYLNHNPHVWAYIDRILFIRNLTYLSEAEDIEKMVKLSQHSAYKRMTKTIDLNDIQNLAECIVSPPTLITGSIIFKKYAEAVTRYRKEREEFVDDSNIRTILPQITDRRIDKVSQIIEISAVMDGRRTAKIEDLSLCHVGLCHTEEEKTLWLSIADDKIQSAKAMKKDDLSKLQSQKLSEISSQFDGLQLEQVLKSLDEDQARVMIDVVKEMILELQQVNPENDVVTTFRDEMNEKMNKSLEELVEHFNDIILR